MKKTCQYYDGTETYRFDATCFPITLGGSNVDIKLPSVSLADGVAYIDISDGMAFIQPEERSRVFLNETRLVESSWLQSGDIIGVGESLVKCEIEGLFIKCHLIPDKANKNRPLSPPSRPKSGLTPPLNPVKIQDEVKKPSVGMESSPGKWPGIRSVIISLILLILLTLTGFVFLAAPVTIKVSPIPDELKLEEGLINFQWDEQFLVWPGTYRLIADKPGYISLNEMMNITKGTIEPYQFKMEKLGGFLTFSSKPVARAEVFVDGKSIGKAPLVDIPLKPGKHRIVFKYPRYQDDEKEIEVDGAGKKQRLAGELIPDWAAVEFDSDPQVASVEIDGENLGKTPVKLDVLAGKHKLKIKKAGFESWTGTLRVVAGEDQNFKRINLDKLSGVLHLVTRPSAVSVVVDGTFRGRSPITLKLEPEQKHQIKLFKAGYSDVNKNIKLASGEKKKVELALDAEYGKVTLVGIPAGAQLFIDDKESDKVSGEFKLSTGSHQIEIKKQGYLPFKNTVTIRHGLSQEIKVSMSRIDTDARTGKKRTATSAMAFFKPGRFMMGASRREQGRRSNEVLHEVQLTRAYYIGKKEVTNAEYRVFKPAHSSGSIPGHSLNGDQQPVVNVSWDDAARYGNWLSKKHKLTPVYREKSGKMVAIRPLPDGYRLPTEAEWVWAGRYAGQSDPLKYPWGDKFPPASNSGNYAAGDKYPVSAPVGKFKPNQSGMYDIGGNVSEWVHDYYSIFSGFEKKTIKDPMGPVNGKHHVVRGSNWKQDSISELRLSYRDYASKPRSDLGFRVARYAGGGEQND